MVLKYLQVIKSQAEIAQKAGTTDKDGTLVYKVRDTLNYYLDGDPYMYVRIDQVNFTNSTINTLQLKKPAIFLVRTGVLPTYEGMDYGHYIVGTGYLVQWSLTGQMAKVYYNDSYNNPSHPNIYGPNIVNAVLMEQAIRNSSGYIIIGK